MREKKLVFATRWYTTVCRRSFTKHRLLYLFLLSFAPLLVSAQFVAPTSPEYTYPPASLTGPVAQTEHTSCYSLSNMTFLTTTGNELLVHAWDGNPTKFCGIAWRRLATGSPTTVYDQGYLLYPVGTRDISVALVSDSGWDGTGGHWEIVVSYYIPTKVVWQGTTLNPGHYYDRWKWNTTGISFITTFQLSSQPTYTRISMDAHNTYGIAITWEEPTGIHVIAGTTWNPYSATTNVLTFGHIVLLNGTRGFTHPDVAFGHPKPTDTSQRLHFVYQTPGGNTAVIYEARTLWAFLLTGITSFTPTTEDMNTVVLSSSNPDFRTHIDCPDHGNDSNWAYVYTTDYMNIKVRIKDVPTSPTPFTVVTNDGSLGNVPINTVMNDWPTIAYDANQGPGSESIYVGWYTLTKNTVNYPFFGPPAGAYIALQLKENGTILNPTGPFSYMTVNATPWNTSPTPNMCFSRQNDLTTYLFNMFVEDSSLGYYIQNRYSPWSAGSFKYTGSGAGPYSYQSLGLKTTQKSNVSVALFPNPVTGNLTVRLSGVTPNGEMAIYVRNMQGQIMTITTASQTNTTIDMHTFQPGNYIVTITDENGTAVCSKQIVKM